MKQIPMAQPVLGKKETEYVLNCLKSGWVSSAGSYIQRFEDEFAKRFGVKHAISTSNGTVALHLSLVALGIKPNDEVIVPALTFVATANTVMHAGAKPVFVDIDHNTWNIDTNEIEQAITGKTRAIIPVHLYGYPAAIDQIMKIAKKHKLFVIEDAAEAHGATFGGKTVGTFGNVGCFSFYGNKILTTGEGGMIVTNNEKIAAKIRLLKNHGMSLTRKYFHPVIGYNYRMTNIQAALGLAQLSQFDYFLKKRREIELLYRTKLSFVPGLVFQPQETYIDSVPWLFSLRVTKPYPLSRNQLIIHLHKNGVDSRPFFYPLPDLPMYKNKQSFPITSLVSKTGINLPTFPALTRKGIEYICNVVKNV